MHLRAENKPIRLSHFAANRLMSAKQAINDKLQGSVAAYLRCGC